MTTTGSQGLVSEDNVAQYIGITICFLLVCFSLAVAAVVAILYRDYQRSLKTQEAYLAQATEVMPEAGVEAADDTMANSMTTNAAMTTVTSTKTTRTNQAFLSRSNTTRTTNTSARLEGLDTGWKRAWSNEHARSFYFNEMSGESTWEKPVVEEWEYTSDEEETEAPKGSSTQSSPQKSDPERKTHGMMVRKPTAQRVGEEIGNDVWLDALRASPTSNSSVMSASPTSESLVDTSPSQSSKNFTGAKTEPSSSQSVERSQSSSSNISPNKLGEAAPGQSQSSGVTGTKTEPGASKSTGRSQSSGIKAARSEPESSQSAGLLDAGSPQ